MTPQVILIGARPKVCSAKPQAQRDSHLAPPAQWLARAHQSGRQQKRCAVPIFDQDMVGGKIGKCWEIENATEYQQLPECAVGFMFGDASNFFMEIRSKNGLMPI